MRAGKLSGDRPSLLSGALIGGGIALIGSGIYCGLVPAYVAWIVTDFDALTRWVDFYRMDAQVQLVLPGGDLWSGHIRGLLVELAIVNSMLLVGTMLIFAGVRAIVRERFRRRAGILNERQPLLAS